MGKKSTKRKTQWRALSITEYPPQHLKIESTKKFAENNTTNINIDESEYNNRHTSTNPLYLKRKSSILSSPQNNRNDYRNNHNNYSCYSNSKHNSTSTTSSVYSSKLSYRRRPYSLQNGPSKYYCSYDAERRETRDKENLVKPLFNEDDYTRITTPRQDVIFKKGYFSQPRKYVSPTDTNTTSSVAASIVSVEESMSIISAPSLSPEQCSSQGDTLDSEQGFIYSFIDQNGVVYSYVPNALDQYNGQMMMLPYGYPPHNTYSSDINSPTCSSEDFDQNRASVDSNKISNDPKKNIAEGEEPVESSNDEGSTTNEENTEGTNITTNEENNESAVINESEDTRVCDASKDTVQYPIAQHVAGQFINYGYQQPCYPHVVYPYLFPQHFMSVFGNDYDASNEICDEDLESQNRVRYRCRQRDNTDGNSTGISATTTDYSEDELSDSDDITEVNKNIPKNIDQCEVETENSSTQFAETEPKQITLNTNVKEFVPRAVTKTCLNVNVKEFLPRKYTNQDQKQEESKEAVICDPQLPSAEEKDNESINHKEMKIEKPSVNKNPTYHLTLAEKIKQRLNEEFKAVTQKKVQCEKVTSHKERTERRSSHKNDVVPDCVERKSLKNMNKKKDGGRAIRSQPSYAQIANKNKTADQMTPKTIVTKAEKPKDFKVDRTVPLQAQAPVDTPAQVQIATPVQVKAPTVKSSAPIILDTWRIVKLRGKRNKHFKEEDIKEGQTEEAPTELEEVLSTQPSIDLLNPPQLKEESSSETKVPSELKATTSLSSEKKKPSKSQNRKTSKKSPTSHKKTKKLELDEPNSELYKKTEISHGDNTKGYLLNNKPTKKYVVEVQQDGIEEVLEGDNDTLHTSRHTSPGQSDANLTFDRLYLGKGFGRSQMDILKRFDYKYNNKLILREEEEMVLNVIKSLNNSVFDKKSDSTIIVEENIECRTFNEPCDDVNFDKNCSSETVSVPTENIILVKDNAEINEIKTMKVQSVTHNETAEKAKDEVICNANIANSEIEKLTSTIHTLEEASECGGNVEVVEVIRHIVDNNSDQEKQEKSTAKNEEDKKDQTNGPYYCKDFYEEPTITKEPQNELVSCGQENIISKCEDASHELIKNEINNSTHELIKEVKTTKVFSGFDESMYKTDDNKVNSLSLKSIITQECTPATLLSNHLITTINETQLKNDFTNIASDDKNPHARKKLDLQEGSTEEETNTEKSSPSEFAFQMLLENSDDRTENSYDLNRSIFENDTNETSILFSECISDKAEPFVTSIKESCSDMQNICIKNNENRTSTPIKLPSNSEKESLDYIHHEEVLSNLIKVGIPAEEEINVAEVNAISQGWNLILKNESNANSYRIPEIDNVTSSNGHLEIEDCEECEESRANSEILKNFENHDQNEFKLSEIENPRNCVENKIITSLTNGYVNNRLEDEYYTVNGSISDNHSSDIGSDYDSSHPASAFDLKDPLDKLSTHNKGNDTVFQDGAENDCNSERKTKYWAENALPMNNQLDANSVCCDTQSVSYTSNTKLSTNLSSNEAKGGVDAIDNMAKYPNKTELDSNDVRFPLTEAVKQWLSEETKELTPEPILRIPTDPNLNLLKQQIHFTENESNWPIVAESHDVNDSHCPSNTNSKNLKSNSSLVSFVNIVNDNNSDCNINNMQRYEDNNDNTRERVAKILSDNKLIIHEKCDLLDYWDDEFIRNSQKVAMQPSLSSHCTSMDHESTSNATTSNEQCEPYESLYGTTINYNQLLASKSVFLSSNILSFNNGNANNNYTRTNYHKNDTSPINNNNNNKSNNNFDNINRITTTSATTIISPTTQNIRTKNSENCLTPPDLCCILM